MSGACGSINLPTVAQSPLTWLGHTRSVKIQLFLLSYSRVLNSFVWRIPGVNSSQKFITGQMLFVAIRRLETVQRNSLSIKHRNEETRREKFIKAVNNWGFHREKRKYCTNCKEHCTLINPLNAELNPICHLLALLGAHHIFHVSGLRVNLKVPLLL